MKLNNMQELPDENILKAYRDGDHDKAFSLLLNSYQERLYWHIRRMLFSHEDTDDVLQNTFVKAWKGLAGFKSESKLYTWLFRIASNETYSFLEKNKKRKFHLDVAEHLSLTSTDSAEDMDGDAIQIKLEQALATLPEKQREVFHLKYYEDLKYTDISEVTGTSVGGLKASYHLAVNKIEKYLTSN